MLKIYSKWKRNNPNGSDAKTLPKIQLKETEERVCGSCKYYSSDNIRNLHCTVNGRRRMPDEMIGCIAWKAKEVDCPTNQV